MGESSVRERVASCVAGGRAEIVSSGEMRFGGEIVQVLYCWKWQYWTYGAFLSGTTKICRDRHSCPWDAADERGCYDHTLSAPNRNNALDFA